MCVTDRHGMTLAVKVALNPNTINHLMVSQHNSLQVEKYQKIISEQFHSREDRRPGFEYFSFVDLMKFMETESKFDTSS